MAGVDLRAYDARARPERDERADSCAPPTSDLSLAPPLRRGGDVGFERGRSRSAGSPRRGFSPWERPTCRQVPIPAVEADSSA